MITGRLIKTLNFSYLAFLKIIFYGVQKNGPYRFTT